ncbi:Hypothetical_protein [Hexamita inflata]|uniref:Hypothetical_protein n=1 Tax=Hexamita inflata TaxID=28002 RepID=A0ABP1HGS0_9EUKA
MFTYRVNGDNLYIGSKISDQQCQNSLSQFDLLKYRRINITGDLNNDFELCGIQQHNKFLEINHSNVNFSTFSGMWEKVQLKQCNCVNQPVNLQIRQLILYNTVISSEQSHFSQSIDIFYDMKVLQTDFKLFSNLNLLCISNATVDLSQLSGVWKSVKLINCICTNQMQQSHLTVHSLELQGYMQISLDQIISLQFDKVLIDIISHQKAPFVLYPLNSHQSDVLLENYIISPAPVYNELTLVHCTLINSVKTFTNNENNSLILKSCDLNSCDLNFKTISLNNCLNIPQIKTETLLLTSMDTNTLNYRCENLYAFNCNVNGGISALKANFQQCQGALKCDQLQELRIVCSKLQYSLKNQIQLYLIQIDNKQIEQLVEQRNKVYKQQKTLQCDYQQNKSWYNTNDKEKRQMYCSFFNVTHKIDTIKPGYE